MDGFQFLVKLEAGGISLSEDIFIVMHTASLLPDHKKKADTNYKGKIKGFVHKPLQEQYIRETISSVMSRSQKEEQTTFTDKFPGK